MAEDIPPKWLVDLVDLFRCRICLEPPGDRIHQCIEGHPTCENCKSLMDLCPFCKKEWCASRDDLAESMRQKLYDVKWTLMIGSTDPWNELLKLASNVPGEASGRSQELYPCCIDYCSSILPYEQLLEHISVEHPHKLQTAGHNVGFVIFHVENTEQVISDHAFSIPECGTFFSKISSDQYGNLNGCVLMIGTATASEAFEYELDIVTPKTNTTNRDHLWHSKGQVQSCRTSREKLAKKNLIALPSTKRPSIDDVKSFECSLTIISQLGEHAEISGKIKWKE